MFVFNKHFIDVSFYWLFFHLTEKRQNDNKTTYITDNLAETHRTELFEFPISLEVIFCLFLKLVLNYYNLILD